MIEFETMARETLEYHQWERLVTRQQLVRSAGISCDEHAAYRAKCLQEIKASGSNLPKTSAPLRSRIAKQEQGGVTVEW